MKSTALVAAVAAAAVALVGVAIPTTASAAAPCGANDYGPEEPPSIIDLPARLIEGRKASFVVREGLSYEPMTVTMAEPGLPPFYRRTFARALEPLRLDIQAVAGQGPIVVTVTQDSLVHLDFSTSPVSFTTCSLRVSQTVETVSPPPLKAFPPPRVTDSGIFKLQPGPNCASTYATTTPVTVSMRPHGTGAWTSIAASDPCKGWDRTKVRGPGFQLHRSGRNEMHFEPSIARRPRLFDWKIGAQRGQFRVQSRKRPATESGWTTRVTKVR